MDMESEFEDYWTKHKDSLYLAAPQALQDELNNTGKMNTAGDWLLQAVPIFVVVGFIEANVISSVILNFLVAALAGIVATLVLVPLKPYVTGKRRASDIEADIKAHFHAVYCEHGLQALEKLRK